MPVYSASSFKQGSAYTATTPSSLVTATATATATSNVSQQDAQNIADTTAQNQANSAAQNDANIISQTLAMSASSLKGQFSHLNLYEGIPSECNNGFLPNSTTEYLAGITGVIYNSDTTQNSLVVTVKKPIYKITSLDTNQPYPTELITPGAYLTASYALSYKNFHDSISYSKIYGAVEWFGSYDNIKTTLANGKTGSVLQGQRTSYKFTPDLNGVDYNIVVVSNVAILCAFPINTAVSSTFTAGEINKGGFLQMNILNKMAQSISTYNPSSQTYEKFDGINMSQTVSSPTVGSENWNYIYSDFGGATLGGSSNSIAYPIPLNTTLNPLTNSN